MQQMMQQLPHQQVVQPGGIAPGLYQPTGAGTPGFNPAAGAGTLAAGFGTPGFNPAAGAGPPGFYQNTGAGNPGFYQAAGAVATASVVADPSPGSRK